MSISLIREPRNLSDPNIWARYENAQNRKLEGAITSYLYSDSGTLKLNKGMIGINDGVTRGVCIVNPTETISLSGISSENWAKIELSVSNQSGIIAVSEIVGETDPDSLPSEFINAYDEIKNGYYITATKRCIGLVFIDEDGELYIINVLSLQNGYYSNGNYNAEYEIFDTLIPQHSELKTKSLVNINMNKYLYPEFYKTWTLQSSAADNEWSFVAWSPELSLFAAVSRTGAGNRVMTSPDGTTWTIRSSAANNEWTSVVWSPELSLFCAVSRTGTGNRVMTSPDGVTWTSRTSAGNYEWDDICWSPELTLFVAVAQTGGGNNVMTSPDGTNWTLRSCSDRQWRAVCWSPDLGLFCAVAFADSSATVMTSPDGTTWTNRTRAANNDWNAVEWSPELGLFAAISRDGTNRVMTSPDGTTWTSRSAAAVNDWRHLVWSSFFGIFVAVSRTGTDNRIMISRDGILWTSRTSAADYDWRGLAYAPELGIFCATAQTGTGDRVMTSVIIQ